jgi:hypothetical protein
MMSDKLNGNLFERLAAAGKSSTLLLAALTLILFIVLGVTDEPLKTSASPNGIVSFELAGNFANAQSILNSWNNRAKMYAAFSLGIDFLFLFAYSFLFAIVIAKLSVALKNRFGENLVFRIGIILTALQFFAAFFDTAENICLINLLFGSLISAFANAAFYFAFLKFAFIVAGISYIVFATAKLIVTKTNNR